MAKRTEQDTRIWDLTIIVGLLVALSALTDIAGFLRFAPSFGLPAWAAVLCVMPVKLIEWKFLTFTARLWRQGWAGKLQSPMVLLPWGIAACLSALAAHATIYTMFATADHTAARNVETRRNLATALDRINGQLDAFPKPLPRPAKTVEQEYGWATSVRPPPRNCTRLLDEGSREACKKVILLRNELAAAVDFERLVQEADKLRGKLAGLRVEAVDDAMPQAYEATIGQFTKMDGKNGIALMGMLLLTLVSAFGNFCLDTLRRGQVSPARPEPARPEPARPEPARNCEPALDPA